MKIVTSGVDDLPQDLAVIKTYNQVKARFPTEGVTATVVVEADDVRTRCRRRRHRRAAGAGRRLGRVPARDRGHLQRRRHRRRDRRPDAAATAPTPRPPTRSTRSATTSSRRRSAGSTGRRVNVSGDAAQSAGLRDQLNSRLPLIFAFVFGLAFLLLLVTFRSIVIPIKAILLNLLSVGAAYGVLVLVFQNGHGESLLGFTSNGGVTNWLPLFLFVILFGLSMDYHVFILSRVRELHDRGMSTDDAVRQRDLVDRRDGDQRRVVMVGVFAVFATLSFLDFKEIGLGLAVAVLIDATIIRGVLLPASMKVLGDWNWYLPSWLEWLPHVGAEGDAALPEGGGRRNEARAGRTSVNPAHAMTAPDRRIELPAVHRRADRRPRRVPLAWAALLWFRPNIDPDRVFKDAPRPGRHVSGRPHRDAPSSSGSRASHSTCSSGASPAGPRPSAR